MYTRRTRRTQQKQLSMGIYTQFPIRIPANRKSYYRVANSYEKLCKNILREDENEELEIESVFDDNKKDREHDDNSYSE